MGWQLAPQELFRGLCMRGHFSHVWLCDSMDYNPLGSSVQGILQERILEWVAIPFSRQSSQPRDWTHISYGSCIICIFFTTEPPGIERKCPRSWGLWQGSGYLPVSYQERKLICSFLCTLFSIWYLQASLTLLVQPTENSLSNLVTKLTSAYNFLPVVKSISLAITVTSNKLRG